MGVFARKSILFALRTLLLLVSRHLIQLLFHFVRATPHL
jgi:hypothetical protein